MRVKKEHLYRLIDELPEKELLSAQRYLQYLIHLGENTLLFELENVPYDEEELTEEEKKRSDTAWGKYKTGEDPGKQLDDYIEGK